MIKKIVILIFAALYVFDVSAFEGVIKQSFINIDTKEEKTLVWYIKNDNIRFDVISGEETVSIVPNFDNYSLSMFGNKADKNGNFYYLNANLNEIEVKTPKLNLIESLDCKYKQEDAKEIKLMSEDGLLVVQYLTSIDVNIKRLLSVFAESKEIYAISMIEDKGFPVSSVIMTNDKAVYTLTTNSIEEQTIQASKFTIPSEYKLFDPSTLGN